MSEQLIITTKTQAGERSTFGPMPMSEIRSTLAAFRTGGQYTRSAVRVIDNRDGRHLSDEEIRVWDGTEDRAESQQIDAYYAKAL